MRSPATVPVETDPRRTVFTLTRNRWRSRAGRSEQIRSFLSRFSTAPHISTLTRTETS